MSLNNLVSKYSTEEAQSILEEDSDNDELDKETISDDQHSLSSISDISSDEEDLYRPSDSSSSSDEDQESTRNASQQFSIEMAKLGLLYCLRDQSAQIHPILNMSSPESILLFAARLLLVLMIVGNCLLIIQC